MGFLAKERIAEKRKMLLVLEQIKVQLSDKTDHRSERVASHYGT